MPEDYDGELGAQEKEAEAEAEKRRGAKEKRKKLLAAGAGLAAGILVLLGMLFFVLSAVDSCNKNQAKTELKKNATRRYNYVEPDYDLDIFEDEGYMAKDRDVWINGGALKTVITEANRANYSPEMQFMYDLVNIIIQGDYAAYNKIFTADYLANADEEDMRERFTMQQLFQIEIECVGYRQQGDVSYSDMMLIYRIRNNNGTFRNDLDYNDEGYIPVVYRLVADKNGEIKARGLLTQSQYMSGLYD